MNAVTREVTSVVKVGSLTHSPTHSYLLTLTHLLTHSLTHSYLLTHSYSLTHSYLGKRGGSSRGSTISCYKSQSEAKFCTFNNVLFDFSKVIHPLLTHSLTYLLTHSLTHSLTHLLTYSLTHLLTYSLTHSLTHLLTYSLTHSLTYLLIHSLTYLLIHSLDDG